MFSGEDFTNRQDILRKRSGSSLFEDEDETEPVTRSFTGKISVNLVAAATLAIFGLGMSSSITGDEAVSKQRVNIRADSETNINHSASWRHENERRLALIDKKYGAGLEKDEERELDELQQRADDHLRKNHPLPEKRLTQFEQLLQQKSGNSTT